MSVSTERLDSVRRRLDAEGIDCLALIPGFNLRYLTGLDFILMERPLILFLPAGAQAEPVLVTPELEVPAWQEEAPFAARIFGWGDDTGPEPAMEKAAGVLEGIDTLGAEYLRMRLLEHDLITRFLPDVQIVRGETIMDPLRIRKDAAEIAAHRKAIDVVEAALEEVVSQVMPGMTERDVCSRLTASILDHGGESVAIEPLVQSGPRSAMPHGRTGTRLLRAGDILLIDFTTTVDGYYADITRTFFVGQEPDEQQRRVYEVVKAANAAGRAAVRPGVTCQAVDRATRQVIVDAGLGEAFLHRTGHGLGLDVHEEPGIAEGNELVLEEGMVFTIEPGVYLDDWGGVRIEDNVVVTEDGCESLTTFDRDVRVIGT